MSVVWASDLEGKVPKRGVNLILLFVLAWQGISKRLKFCLCKIAFPMVFKYGSYSNNQRKKRIADLGGIIYLSLIDASFDVNWYISCISSGYVI